MAGEDLFIDVDGARAMAGWLDSFKARLTTSTDDLVQEFAPTPGAGEPSGAMLAHVLDSQNEAMRAETKDLCGKIETTEAEVLADVNTFIDADGANAHSITSAVGA